MRVAAKKPVARQLRGEGKGVATKNKITFFEALKKIASKKCGRANIKLLFLRLPYLNMSTFSSTWLWMGSSRCSQMPSRDQRCHKTFNPITLMWFFAFTQNICKQSIPENCSSVIGLSNHEPRPFFSAGCGSGCLCFSRIRNKKERVYGSG